MNDENCEHGHTPQDESCQENSRMNISSNDDMERICEHEPIHSSLSPLCDNSGILTSNQTELCEQVEAGTTTEDEITYTICSRCMNQLKYMAMTRVDEESQNELANLILQETENAESADIKEALPSLKSCKLCNVGSVLMNFFFDQTIDSKITECNSKNENYTPFSEPLDQNQSPSEESCHIDSSVNLLRSTSSDNMEIICDHESLRSSLPALCDTCGILFSSNTELSVQVQVDQDNICNECGIDFEVNSLLHEHLQSNHAKLASCFTCETCYEAFLRADLAYDHVKSHHCEDNNDTLTVDCYMNNVPRLYLCEFCEKRFSDGHYLNQHREIEHASCKPFVIEDSSINRTKPNKHNQLNIEEEIRNGMIPTVYLCEFCNRFFVNCTKYAEHLTIHDGPESYFCKKCNLQFSNLSQILKHRSTEEDHGPFDDYNISRPFGCHYCSKGFVRRDTLTKHIRTHSGEKPFLCDKCGKVFTQSSGLLTHKKVHSENRPYPCLVCDKTFKIKGDRNVHMKTHLCNKRYTCEICGRRYSSVRVYDEHMKVHSGRKLRCNKCGMTFGRSQVLSVHKKVHTGEKKHTCEACGRGFRTKGNLIKHKNVMHRGSSQGKIPRMNDT